MPLVKLDKNYQAELLDREVRKRKAEFRISNKVMANWLGVTERGLNYKRNHGTYTLEDLSIIFDHFQFSVEAIGKVFRRLK